MKASTFRLGEICEIISGATPNTSVKEYWDGDVDWVTPADLSKLQSAYISKTERRISAAGLKSCATKILPPHSVLLSSRAPIGHVAINTVPMATNQGFKSLVPDKKRVDSKYLYYWLVANRARIQGLGNGATFKEVSKATVSNIEIPLPPIDEQRRIAAILDKADALRQKRKQTIALFDGLTQSIFLELFGDPVNNPRHWQRATLGDVIHQVSDGPHVSPEYSDTGIPFLSTRHITRQGIKWEDLKYISQQEAEIHWRKCKPERGDILYTKGGTTGIASTITFDRRIAVWVHVALLKPKKTIVEPLWLETMLNTDYCYQQSQRFTHGIANRDLGLKRMVNINMYLPPIDLQRSFTAKLFKARGLIEKALQAATQEEKLFSSLQHRAFSGEL